MMRSFQRMEWNERDCRNCKRQLGCPHSTLAGEFVVEPTDDMKPVIMKMLCDNLKIREDAR